MPHTIALTRTTTTTTTSSAIIINVGIFKTIPGILKALESGTGLLCFIIILVTCRTYYDPYLQTSVGGFGGGKAETSFLLVVFASFFCTTLLLVACIGSLATATVLAKTNFDFIYHLVAFAFYLITSLVLLIEVASRNERSYSKERGYGGKVAAAVFGLINSLFYLLSTIFAYRAYTS